METTQSSVTVQYYPLGESKNSLFVPRISKIQNLLLILQLQTLRPKERSVVAVNRPIMLLLIVPTGQGNHALILRPLVSADMVLTVSLTTSSLPLRVSRSLINRLQYQMTSQSRKMMKPCCLLMRNTSPRCITMALLLLRLMNPPMRLMLPFLLRWN